MRLGPPSHEAEFGGSMLTFAGIFWLRCHVPNCRHQRSELGTSADVFLRPPNRLTTYQRTRSLRIRTTCSLEPRVHIRKSEEESYGRVQCAIRVLAQTLQLSYHGKRQAAPSGGSVGHRHLRGLFGLRPGVSVRLEQNEES